MELLAKKMAPKSVDDVIGQKHLLGEGKILKNLIDNQKLFSMILYGPPGIGKTSIANAIVNDLGIRYRFFNAVTNNKKDLDVIIEEGKMYGEIVLIVDEIHRLNKDKQDVLLPHLESGLITLIGMTTSNPYIKINPAIRSRCQIYELKELAKDDIIEGLNKAIKHEDLTGIKIDDESINYIASVSGNDLRYAYNLLEVAFYSTSDKVITIDVLKNINNKPNLSGDMDETEHYNLLSALQKSIRGSDVDAALHYAARLLEIGDTDSLFRRLSVIAYEDIGLANPDIGCHLKAAIDAAQLVGLPEGRIPIGEIVIEMALSPKSNTAHVAFDMAIEDVKSGRCGPIPETIRINSPIYKYPHDYPNSYVVQQYMPDNMIKRKYYFGKNSSKYEIAFKHIKEKLDKIKETNSEN